MRRGIRSWGMAAVLVAAFSPALSGRDLQLQDLVAEALRNSPEIKAAEARAEAASLRVSMEGSLMDPMFSVGYQNEGLKEYNYGETPDAQWKFSLAQTFPFPGKRTLQEEAAALEAEAERLAADQTRRDVVLKVTEAYYDLLLVARELDLIRQRSPLIDQVEGIALKRYAAGTLSQDEVLMAQAEKYMLLEAGEMAENRKETAEAAIRQAVGRADAAPLGTPGDAMAKDFPHTLEELVDRAYRESPEILMREKLMQASEKRVARAQKEAWPDITVMGQYMSRGGGLEDMAELTFSVPLPLYYGSRQGAGISESSWSYAGVRSELEAARLKAASEIRDDLAMIRAADRIVQLYRNALLPKSRQAIEAALAAFTSGRMEASMVLAKLKAPFEYELAAWQQQILREKAIARIEALTGTMEVR